MTHLNKIFFRGLVSIIPVFVTLYLLFWIVSLMETLVGQFLKFFIPSGLYIPGLGVISTLILILVFGLLLDKFIKNELIYSFERRLKSIPFFKSVYSPLRDLMNLFSQSKSSSMKRVVLVKITPDIKILGVVTRENFSDLPSELQVNKTVSVYCPWSYGMGGFTLLVRLDQIEPVDIPIEKAMSLAITGWVKTDSKSFNEELNKESMN